MVKSDKTKDPFLALRIKNIWLLTASYDINLGISHIPGCYNIIADTLSRIYSVSPVQSDVMTVLRADYILERVPGTYFNLDTHL